MLLTISHGNRYLTPDLKMTFIVYRNIHFYLSNTEGMLEIPFLPNLACLFIIHFFVIQIFIISIFMTI